MTDYEGRAKLVTIHLPIEMGVMLAVISACEPLMDPEDSMVSQVETSGDFITLYGQPK